MNKPILIYIFHAFVLAPFFYYVGMKGNRLLGKQKDKNDVTFDILIWMSFIMFTYHLYKLVKYSLNMRKISKIGKYRSTM